MAPTVLLIIDNGAVGGVQSVRHDNDAEMGEMKEGAN